jgi:hypothetical protein
MTFPTDSDAARQAARTWSGRLGTLAAASPAVRPGAALTQLGAALPPALPIRLAPILNHLRQRHQRRQHAADELRAEEFVMAP